jgi:hypothetical protein
MEILTASNLTRPTIIRKEDQIKLESSHQQKEISDGDIQVRTNKIRIKNVFLSNEDQMIEKVLSEVSKEFPKAQNSCHEMTHKFVFTCLIVWKEGLCKSKHEMKV